MAKKINNNQAIINLMKEKKRLDDEKVKIQNRIKLLKQDLKEYYETDNPVKSFDIDRLEDQAVNTTVDVIKRKIKIFESALNQSYFNDEKYRIAAKEYIDSIEDIVKENDQKILQNNKNIDKLKKQLEEMDEKRINDNDDLNVENDNIFSILGESVSCFSGDLTGGYVLNKIKNKLKG